MGSRSSINTEVLRDKLLVLEYFDLEQAQNIKVEIILIIDFSCRFWCKEASWTLIHPVTWTSSRSSETGIVAKGALKCQSNRPEVPEIPGLPLSGRLGPGQGLFFPGSKPTTLNVRPELTKHRKSRPNQIKQWYFAIRISMACLTHQHWIRRFRKLPWIELYSCMHKPVQH